MHWLTIGLIYYEIEMDSLEMGMRVLSVSEIQNFYSNCGNGYLTLWGKAFVEDVIPILVVSFHCQLDQLVAQSVNRIARSDLGNVSFERELPYEVAEKIKSLKSKQDDEITLDEACALHYAVAYCDPKVVKEAERTIHNSGTSEPRGFCIRADMGWTDCCIRWRLTRPKDYNAKMEQGQEANKDKLYIDVLEREVLINSLTGDSAVSSPTLADNLHTKLLSLEKRVFIILSICFHYKIYNGYATKAMCYLPRLALLLCCLCLTTLPYGGQARNGNSSCLDNIRVFCCYGCGYGNSMSHGMSLCDMVVDKWRWVCAYFPNCSQVLDNFMEDDLPDLFYLEKGTLEEQKIKRMRFMEFKEDVEKAFRKDRAEINRSGLSSASSSSSLKDGTYGKGGK
ncbi:NPR1/NIM1-like, C-terminal [Dillenia turbinata]|uniref:NPR1/NIM1-like, C-terminal n=1 Tax=Dillenia turbinata TaxID=194707 RepID=A0AAN8VQG3_9MAGN